ncbi:hypothetical protein E8E13_000979 [Curvularia kusanoi]|uniref:Uncharacterized protein n=1 Tax=Curvularia kusanoi TaxID=90978 RepID=A0A9P4W3J2_CURKU|nr:hypothetical protein E8E13_000979 [Curvularia kusanoi]
MASTTPASSVPAGNQPQTDMQAVATLNLQVAVVIKDFVDRGADTKLPEGLRVHIDRLINHFFALKINSDFTIKSESAPPPKRPEQRVPTPAWPLHWRQYRTSKIPAPVHRSRPSTKRSYKSRLSKKKVDSIIVPLQAFHVSPPEDVSNPAGPPNEMPAAVVGGITSASLPELPLPSEGLSESAEPRIEEPAFAEGVAPTHLAESTSSPITEVSSSETDEPPVSQSPEASSTTSISSSTSSSTSSSVSSPPTSPESIEVDEPEIPIADKTATQPMEDIQAELSIDIDEPEVVASDTIPCVVSEDLPKPMEDVQANVAEVGEEGELLEAWSQGYDATPTMNMTERSVVSQETHVPEAVMTGTTEDAPSGHTVELEMTEVVDVVEEPAIQDAEMVTAPPLTNSLVIMTPLTTLAQAQSTPTMVASVPPLSVPPPPPTVTVGTTTPASIPNPPPTATVANGVYLPYTLRAQPTSQSSRAEQVVAPQSSGNGDLKGKLDFLTMKNHLRAIHSYAMGFSLSKQHPAAFDLPWNHDAAMKRLMDWLIKSNHLGRGTVHQAEEKLKDMCKPGSPASAAEELLWQCNAFISQAGLQPTQLPSPHRITYEGARSKGVRDIYTALVNTNLEIIKRGLEASPMPWANIRTLAIREEYSFLATRLGTTQPRGEHLYQRYIRERVAHWQDVDMVCLLFTPPVENHNSTTLKRSKESQGPAVSSKRVKEVDDRDEVDEQVKQNPRTKRQSDQQINPAGDSKRRAHDQDQGDTTTAVSGRRIFAPLRGPKMAGP